MLIWMLVSPPTYWVNDSEVWVKVKKVYERVQSNRVILSYLKDELGYSYKRDLARSLWSTDPK